MRLFNNLMNKQLENKMDLIRYQSKIKSLSSKRVLSPIN